VTAVTCTSAITPQFQRTRQRPRSVAELEALGFGTPAGRENTVQIIDVVAQRMSQKPYDDWAASFEAADVPYAEPQWTEDLLRDPQVAHEGLAVEIET
jgi:crotonobetainyl-CoA:carnitine CoA-transferase CaiB-like acyl-CoA transferase